MVQAVTMRDKMSVRTMLVLVLPTLGFSTGLSLVTTYLPLILERYTESSTLIGFAIGGEGIFSALHTSVGGCHERPDVDEALGPAAAVHDLRRRRSWPRRSSWRRFSPDTCP